MGVVVVGRVALVAWASIHAIAAARAEPRAAAERFDATLQRPLFSPTRRPPPPPAVIAAPSITAAVAPPAAPPPNVALSGVIVGAGGGVALLRRPTDPVPARVALGAKVDGWTVAEIHPRSIVLRRDTRSVTIDLPAPVR